jgi:hypothetical protein
VRRRAVPQDQDVEAIEDASPDPLRWEQKVKQRRMEGLKPLQERADAWAETITAPSSASLARSPSLQGRISLRRLTQNVARPVFGLIVAAGMLAAAAIATAAYAAQGEPRWYESLSGRTLRDQTLAASKRRSNTCGGRGGWRSRRPGASSPG